ncbi:MAG: 2-phospho-L-lactate guanylyltransferase [Chloroflexia bacterium]|nr:2-phospho-L-lactate guanylyltransferase [Chloroflexia bacterium]
MSERIVAVVPIRSLHQGKSRLASVLEPGARLALLRFAAGRVIAAACDSGVVETILVVSPDPATLDWAAALGPRVVPLAQPESAPGLNGAIDAGRGWALAAQVTAMLSLFADLPFLAPDDIQTIASRVESVVLGADRRANGTNALLLRLDDPGTRFRFSFGEGSLGKHLTEARRLKLDVAVHHAPGIGFDLDTPEDWADFLTLSSARALAQKSNLAACGAVVG